MRIVGIYLLGVLLAVVLHLTWHFALPSEHGFSLEWSSYWILPAVGFLAAGAIVARLWPHRALGTALSASAVALVLNQGVVPVFSVLVEEQRLGYPLDPVWWNGFALSVALGLPLLCVGAWFFRPRAKVVEP